MYLVHIETGGNWGNGMTELASVQFEKKVEAERYRDTHKKDCPRGETCLAWISEEKSYA